MNHIKILIFIFCLAVYASDISFCRVELTADEHKFLELRTYYGGINDNIMQYMANAENEIRDLRDNTSVNLNLSISQTFKSHFPSCEKGWPERLLESVVEAVKGSDNPCFEIFNIFLNLTFEELQKGAQKVMPILHATQKARARTPNREFGNHVKLLKAEVEALDKRWSNYKQSITVIIWRQIPKCYSDLSMRAKEKLLALSIPPERCQDISNYQEFLGELSMFPFTLNKVIGDMDQLYKPNNIITLHRTPYGKSYLLLRLNTLKIDITLYLESLRFVGKVIHEELSKVNDTIFAKHLSPSRDPHLLAQLLLQLHDFYHGDLKNKCLQKLPEARGNFTNILYCDLPSIKVAYNQIRNCWTDSEECEEISERLESIQLSLSLWKDLGRSGLEEQIRNCFATTTAETVLRLVGSYHTSPYLLHQLLTVKLYTEPFKHQIHFPEVPNSRICTNQTENPTDVQEVKNSTTLIYKSSNKI